MIVHAGCLALWTRAGWRAVLLEGASGVGKSDLALRLLGQGLRLVADDRTQLWISGGRLFGSAPETLAGLMELRGVGIVSEPHLRFSEIALCIECVAPGVLIERMPEPSAKSFLGLTVPQLPIAPLEPSAPFKVRRALASLGQGEQGAYQAAAVEPRGGSR